MESSQSRKRKVNVDENNLPTEPRKSRFDPEIVPVQDAPLDAQALLAAAESDEVEPVDETNVKKMILQFEKRTLKNQEMRVKFPDEPQKFMDSELELNEAIQEMHAVAAAPELYYLLVESTVVTSLLQLLGHENTDVSVAVVDLLQELTDIDTLYESEQSAQKFTEALQNGQIIGLLVQNIERLDESKKDEADGVHNSLAVVENLLEFNPDLCKTAVEQNLLTWLLRRVRQKSAFDGNKFYASEILGVLLQQSEEAKTTLGQKDGIDILLQAVAAYKRHNPKSEDEREYMENLFNCLCAALMYAPNRDKFLEGEGLQLMNLMLRERKDSRESALKVLDYAMTGLEGRANCNKFVEILGLRTLFPLFMKTPNKHKRKGHSAEEHEEHVVAVVASLMRQSTSENRTRILAKFSEQDYAKVDRLIELYLRYEERVRDFEKEQMDTPKSSEDTDEEELHLQKLDAGLFTLQLALILADTCVNGESGVKQRALKLLSMKGSSLKAVKTILEEHKSNLAEDAEEERNRVDILINKIS